MQAALGGVGLVEFLLQDPSPGLPSPHPWQVVFLCCLQPKVSSAPRTAVSLSAEWRMRGVGKQKWGGVCWAVWHACMLSRSVVSGSDNLWTEGRQTPVSWGFPGRNTGVGCHFLLQGIFPTQGSNPQLPSRLHYRQILLPLNHIHCVKADKEKGYFYVKKCLSLMEKQCLLM